MTACRHQVEGGDDVRDLFSKSRPVAVVGPADVSGLHGDVELIADIGTGEALASRRAVSCSGVWVEGVTLAAVRSDAEDPRRFHSSLRTDDLVV